MRKVLVVFAVVALATVVFAQDAGSQASENATATAASAQTPAQSAASAMTLQAELSKSIDAKKAKVGDEVTAKTTADATTSSGMKIPRGTKLIGHVTEAKARTKEDAQSILGFVFDRAVLKSGQEVPLNAVVRGVIAPAQPAMSASTMGDMSAPTPGSMTATDPATGRTQGGAAGTVGSTAGSSVGTVGDAAQGIGTNAGSAAGSSVGAAGQTINGNVNGATGSVIGIKDVQLQPASSSTAATGASTSAGHAQGTVLTSSKSNVRLDGGTQVILVVSSEANAGVSSR